MALAVLMAGAGALHFVIPQVYGRIVPRFLGDPDPWVYGSGVAELVCAGLVAVPRTRRAGGWATAALFIAVFPGNIQHAILQPGWVTFLRLPLQIPLIWWAVTVARRATRG